MFGRATIRLGIGPHSSCIVYYCVCMHCLLYTSDAADDLKLKLECGPMPNVMVTLLKTGGALCSMPQSLADAHY